MTLDPRPALFSLLRTTAALAAIVFLTAGLAACTPEPAEVDESPVAGMSEENPSDDKVLGEAIEVQAGGNATLTLSGTPAVDGAAEVTCAVQEAPASHGDAASHAETTSHADHAGDAHAGDEAVAEHQDAAEAEAEDHDAEEHGTEAVADGHGGDGEHADGHGGGDHGEGDHGGGEDGHAGGHLVLAKTATFALTPPGDAPLRLVVEIPDYDGEGEYDAVLRLEGIAEDGSYAESTGSGTATVEKGTLLSSSAATHWISGTFEGTYAGDAGQGEASGSVERCYYFK